MYAPHPSPQHTGRHRVAGFIAIAIVSLLLGFVFSAPAARAAETAETFVSTSVEKGTAILNNRALSVEERQQRFRDFVLSITDAKQQTQVERKLGPFIDTFVASMLLAQVDGTLPKLNARIRSGLQKMCCKDREEPNDGRQLEYGRRLGANPWDLACLTQFVHGAAKGRSD